MEYLPAMRSFLFQPYPFGENVRKKLSFCAGIGVFVLFFLSLFQPFGFDELATAKRWEHAFFFGAVTFFISSFCQVVFIKIFPGIFREERWRSWKEIVFLLITTAFIGAANYALMLYLYPQNTTLANFFRAELITLQVGIFPICFVVFMKQMTLYRRFAAEAKQVTKDIHSEEENVTSAQPSILAAKIYLRGDNQKEELTIPADDLFFIASADNYVNVVYRQGGGQKSILMRGSLKKMEEQLAAHQTFFRCHRMYLVNLRLVTSVSGNAQGLKLSLSGIEEAVPVSRSLTETVKEKLHELSHLPQKA